MESLTLKSGQARAERRLIQFLKEAQTHPGLIKLGPKKVVWTVQVNLVGSAAMTRLNTDYRGKKYPTDILSFPAPAPFRKVGLLGELVICLPTLNAQAKTLGHSSRRELDVLLAHGLLHLLGLDHEKGAREALLMAGWERKLLKGVLGLIDRSESGTNEE